MTRAELFERGRGVMVAFCEQNALPMPRVHCAEPTAWSFGVCAYYRGGVTTICIPKCASIGTVGRQWSYPGYTVDRTPYGVLQHELGHHVDVYKGLRKAAYSSDFSAGVRGQAGEKQITSYCPNDAEWFAEMFRVFVTNPDLLRIVRPRTYRELSSCFSPIFSDSWRERLNGAPERTIAAAARKIEEASE